MIERNADSLELTVDQMVRQLSKAYTSIIRSNTAFKAFPSVMIWGPPGVGKSQGIRQVAKEIAEKTGKRVEITDVRLLLFNPVDLRGIPTANEDKTLSVWLKPKIFQMDESADVVNILFLDEISAVPQTHRRHGGYDQAAALRLLRQDPQADRMRRTDRLYHAHSGRYRGLHHQGHFR